MAAIRRERSARTSSDHDGRVRTMETARDVSSGTGAQEPRVSRRARRMASGHVIRKAAASLFLEKGYHDTSMDDIAEAARIPKQTIYTLFADKEALFADLVFAGADRVDEFVQGLVQAARDAPNARTALRELGRRYVHTVGVTVFLAAYGG